MASFSLVYFHQTVTGKGSAGGPRCGPSRRSRCGPSPTCGSSRRLANGPGSSAVGCAPPVVLALLVTGPDPLSPCGHASPMFMTGASSPKALGASPTRPCAPASATAPAPAAATARAPRGRPRRGPRIPPQRCRRPRRSLPCGPELTRWHPSGFTSRAPCRHRWAHLARRRQRRLPVRSSARAARRHGGGGGGRPWRGTPRGGVGV